MVINKTVWIVEEVDSYESHILCVMENKEMADAVVLYQNTPHDPTPHDPNTKSPSYPYICRAREFPILREPPWL